MRTKRWAAACVAGVMALACGRSGSVQERAAARPDTTGNIGDGGTPQGGTPAVPCDGIVTVIVRGVDAGSFGTFDLTLASLTATTGGAAVTPDWAASGTMSLAGGATPVLFAMNRSDQPVGVTLAVGAVHVCDAQGCTDLDVCTSPIAFTFDVDKVVPDGCHVFLQLDLAGSVAATSAGHAFLPRFSVKYW